MVAAAQVTASKSIASFAGIDWAQGFVEDWSTGYMLCIAVQDFLLFRPVRFFRLRKAPFLVPVPSGMVFLFGLAKHGKIKPFSESIGSL